MDKNNENESAVELTVSALDNPYDDIKLPDNIINSLVVFFTPLIKDYYCDTFNDE